MSGFCLVVISLSIRVGAQAGSGEQDLAVGEPSGVVGARRSRIYPVIRYSLILWTSSAGRLSAQIV